MTTKYCSKCKETKAFEFFGLNAQAPDGYAYHCKACRKASAAARYKQCKDKILETNRKWSEANKDKHKQYLKGWYEKNKARVLEDDKVWYQANKEVAKERDRKWREANPGKVRERTARRREAVQKATPKWLTEEDKKIIRDIYRKAEEMERLTDIKYHVDHIVPLRAKGVCGLHVSWNLQVISAEENLKKSNKVSDLAAALSA